MKNLSLRAKSEIIVSAEIIPRKNPGVRIQNKVIAFGSFKKIRMLERSDIRILLSPDF
jgi:hypothetical protein